MFGLVFGWFIFSVVAGVIAGSRGRSGFGYFVLSIVLSPLIGIILAAALPNLNIAINPDAATPETHGRCPDCREIVRFDARKCKHCGKTLTPTPVDEAAVKKQNAKKDLVNIGRGILIAIATLFFLIFMFNVVKALS